MASLRQKLLRAFYPVIRKAGLKGKTGTLLHNQDNATPSIPFYQQKVTRIDGNPIDMALYAGKKVILVNTASNCGYTGQYEELQILHERMGDKVGIIGFPANDFAEQEKGSDEEISQFCQINYGVTFSIAKKGVVVKKDDQQPMFKWLTNPEANGWNNHQPDWNFGKYVIDENGNLTNYFGPSISPLDEEFLKVIE